MLRSSPEGNFQFQQIETVADDAIKAIKRGWVNNLKSFIHKWNAKPIRPYAYIFLLISIFAPSISLPTADNHQIMDQTASRVWGWHAFLFHFSTCHWAQWLLPATINRKFQFTQVTTVTNSDDDTSWMKIAVWLDKCGRCDELYYAQQIAFNSRHSSRNSWNSYRWNENFLFAIPPSFNSWEDIERLPRATIAEIVSQAKLNPFNQCKLRWAKNSTEMSVNPKTKPEMRGIKQLLSLKWTRSPNELS